MDQLRNFDYCKKERVIIKKLVRLNGGKLHIPQQNSNYINLTSYKPDDDEETLLQLGLNCHYAEKVDPMKKRLEVEVLLNSIQSLEKKGDVKTSDSLKPLLLAEALTNRSTGYKNLITPQLRNASKRLRQAEGITIRRADKTSSLVLIPTNDYHQKLDEILEDKNKFLRIKKNPVDEIKKGEKNIYYQNNLSSSLFFL